MGMKFNPIEGKFDLAGISQSAADARYLKLDASNDPITGSLTIQGDLNLTSLTTAGARTITVSNQLTSDTSGNRLELYGGNGNGTGIGGDIQAYAGTGGATGAGGSFAFYAGTGGATAGNGGDFLVEAGNAATAGDGGDVNINAGDAAGTNKNGGDVVFDAGARTGSGTEGAYKFRSSTGQYGVLDFGSVDTSQKTFTFPNTTGTVALLQAENAFTTNNTIAGYLRVGSNSAPFNTTAGDLTIARLSIGNSVNLGTTLLASIDGTFASDANNSRGLKASITFSGSGSGQAAIETQPIHQPSASVSAAYGFINIAKGNPDTGVTITNLHGGYNRVDTGSLAGAVTNANGLTVTTPSLGSLIPTTIKGIRIESQNAGSGTTATTIIGLEVLGSSKGTSIIETVRLNYPFAGTSISAVTDCNVVDIASASITLGDQTATTTHQHGIKIGVPTYTSTTNVRTLTNAASIYIAGAPSASTNVIVTNMPTALYVASVTTSVHGGASGGTSATSQNVFFGIPTYTAVTATRTITDAANVYIAGAPAASTNVTITNAYSLWVDAGTTRLDGLVGIGGIAAPVAPLEVTGSDSTADGVTASIKLTNSASGGTSWYLRAGATSTNTPAAGISLANGSGYWLSIKSTGEVGLGVNAPLGKIHVAQASTTAAIPSVYIQQADVSEEIWEITSTAGTGNAIEAVGVKTLTVTEFVKLTINGNTRYVAAGTIA